MSSINFFLAAFLASISVGYATILTTGSRCGEGIDCPAPLSCVGNPSNLRCFMKKALNMRCGQDPFWVCADGLLCVDGVCKTAVDVAGECDAPDTACMGPLSCVGTTVKRCFEKKDVGMDCGQDPFWVCKDGLVCSEGTCRALIGTAGACNEPGDVCEDELSCVGNVGNQKCFEKKDVGMNCGQDPFWVCKDGLVCSEGTCRALIGTAGACNEPGDVCEGELSCVGNVGNQKCFQKKPRGMRCGQDPFWVCEDGLECTSNICV